MQIYEFMKVKVKYNLMKNKIKPNLIKRNKRIKRK